jgi:hypothetical protein
MWSVERGSSKAARFESSCFIVRAPMSVEVTPGRLWTHASETAATVLLNSLRSPATHPEDRKPDRLGNPLHGRLDRTSSPLCLLGYISLKGLRSSVVPRV